LQKNSLTKGTTGDTGLVTLRPKKYKMFNLEKKKVREPKLGKPNRLLNKDSGSGVKITRHMQILATQV